MRASSWFGAVALLLAACAGKAEGPAGSGGASASGLSACDPLAASTSSVKLDAARVVAAGRATDGTLYVVYDADRLFVGSDEHLMERVVLGSGQSGGQTDLDYADDDGTAVTVEVVSDAAGTHMTVARGPQSGKGIDSGNGESLTPVDAALVAKLGASTTAAFEVDFAASLLDGRELVVIAPARGVDYEQFRVFLGPPSALAQRAVTNFGSSMSGQRYATVTLDGVAADLTYLAGGPSKFNPSPAPSTLTVAGTVYALTEEPLAASANYLCFSE